MPNKEPIEGEVTRVEHFGLFVKTSAGEALVLIPDVSSEPVPDLAAAFAVGASSRVRLLRFVPDRGLYKATMILDE